MSRIRKAGLVFAALAVVMAGSARPAGPLTYTDDAGDALDGRASMDIVRVTHDLRQVNKAGPPSLVFEMELAAPPESELVSYYVMSEIEECGSFYASFRPGSVVFGAALAIAPADFYHSCGDGPGDGAILPAVFRIDGNVLRWAVALDSLPKAQRGGLALTDLRAFTQIAEPATGIIGTGWLDGTPAPLPVDTASTDKTWSF